MMFYIPEYLMLSTLLNLKEIKFIIKGKQILHLFKHLCHKYIIEFKNIININ